MDSIPNPDLNKTDQYSDLLEYENRTKILDVVLRKNNDLRVTAIKERFVGMSDSETNEIVLMLLRIASEQCFEKATILKQEDNELPINTPINDGALYDDVVFDCGIYLNDKREVSLNASFGSLTNPQTPICENLFKLSEAINFLVSHMEAAEASTLKAPAASTDKSNRF